MSKTRRNINANRRHVKGGNDEGSMNDHRVDRFMKKMEKRTNTHNRDQEIENDYRLKINHVNYDQFLDDDTFDDADEPSWR